MEEQVKTIDEEVRDSSGGKIHNFLRNIGSAGIAAGILLGSSYFALWGFNNIVYNNDITIGAYRSIKKPDGAFGYTEFEQESGENYKEDSVFQFRLFDYTIGARDGYPFGEPDGLVDTLSIISPAHRIRKHLTRERDYGDYKEQFDNADKYLAQTKERFAHYLIEDKREFIKE